MNAVYADVSKNHNEHKYTTCTCGHGPARDKDARDNYIDIKGPDIISGTPVLDIKPYLPEIESIRGARSAWSGDQPHVRSQIEWDDILKFGLDSSTADAIEETLSLDPRTYQDREASDKKTHGMYFGAYNVRFTANKQTLRVIEVAPRMERR